MNQKSSERPEIQSASEPVSVAGVLYQAYLRFFQRVLTWVAIAIILQVAVILCSGLNPFLELANHFVVHGLIVGILVSPWLFWFKRRGTAALLGLATVYLLVLTAPWNLYLAKPPEPEASQNRQVKVLSWNVLAVNFEFEAALQVINRVDPDVMLLIETRPDFVNSLEGIKDRYPKFYEFPNWGGGGITMLSRLPNIEFEILENGVPEQPALVGTLLGDGGEALVRIVGMHTFSPIPIRRTIVRDFQITGFLEWAKDLETPVCICGDLNLTPWTKAFSNLIQAGFKDSRIGAGNCPSWPSELGPLGIPIDHALSRGDCTITDRSVHPVAPGSDHFPIEFTLHY